MLNQNVLVARLRSANLPLPDRLRYWKRYYRSREEYLKALEKYLDDNNAPQLPSSSAPKATPPEPKPAPAPKPEPELKPEPKPEKAKKKVTHKKLTKLTVPELRAKAKAKKIKGYGSMKKPELVAALRAKK